MISLMSALSADRYQGKIRSREHNGSQYWELNQGETLAVMELRGVSPEIWMFFWPLLWKEPDTTSQIYLLMTGTCWEMVALAGEEPPNTANSALTYIKDLYKFEVDAIWIWQEGTLSTWAMNLCCAGCVNGRGARLVFLECQWATMEGGWKKEEQGGQQDEGMPTPEKSWGLKRKYGNQRLEYNQPGDIFKDLLTYLDIIYENGGAWAYVHCVHTARFPILCEVWWPPSKPWAGKMAKPFILCSIWVVLPVHSLERGSRILYIMWYLPQQHQYFSHIVTQALKLYDQG